MSNTAPAIGTSLFYARADHVHFDADSGGSADSPQNLTFTCSSGLAVGQAVYQDASDHCAAANATSTATAPCIGLEASKPTTTSALVTYAGPVTGLTLIAGDVYYLDKTTGNITGSLAGFTTGNVVQEVGYAKDSTTLIVQLGPETVL